jgi:hypothetical protein
MKRAIVGAVLLFSTPAMAATVYVPPPVHVAPIHVAPTVRVNPGVHGQSGVKPGTKGGTHSRTVTVVTDTSIPKKCDQKSAKGCQKKPTDH